MKLRVLLLALEFPIWRRARSWSYSVQLGIEEGLRANGVQCTTVTTPWFSQIHRLFGKNKFDQVWLDVARPEFLSDHLLDFLTTLAPIRVGRLGESLVYHADEQKVWSSLKTRKQEVEHQLQYITHILACDEKDAEDIGARRMPAMWWPQAVPARFISNDELPAPNSYAVFYGMKYGSRPDWLRHPDLEGLLVYPPSPESGTLYPFLFLALHLPFVGPLVNVWPNKHRALSQYLSSLRYIRSHCFERWLKLLQSGSAVVNLPHFVKTYAGRVVEGMAAGRPVISWQIPDRPRNLDLFEPDREILLYSKDNPSQLAAQIKRVLGDKDTASRLVKNARKKVRAFHTSEIRVRQILNWIETGQEPRYG